MNMERITVADAYQRGSNGWAYHLITINGMQPVKIERDARSNHLYWLHVSGLEQPYAVTNAAAVYATPRLRESDPRFADHVHGVD